MHGIFHPFISHFKWDFSLVKRDQRPLPSVTFLLKKIYHQIRIIFVLLLHSPWIVSVLPKTNEVPADKNLERREWKWDLNCTDAVGSNFIPLDSILLRRLWVSVWKILGVSICKIMQFGITCLIQFVVSIPLPLPTMTQIAQLNVILSLRPLSASRYRRDHTYQNIGLCHLFSEQGFPFRGGNPLLSLPLPPFLPQSLLNWSYGKILSKLYSNPLLLF